MNLIVPTLLPKIKELILSHSDENLKIREKLLFIVYLALKTFNYADDCDFELVKKCFDSTFYFWVYEFIIPLITSTDSNNLQLIPLKLIATKILTVIMRDLPQYAGEEFPKLFYQIWSFFNANIPLFINMHILG